MKKETVEVYLQVMNNRPVVFIKNNNEYTDPQMLIEFLKKGVTFNKIKSCTPREEKGYTSYKFKVYSMEEELNHYFIIKVKNNERYLHKDTINEIKSITGVSNLVKKVNVNRFIAGIAATALVLTVAGPTMAKGMKKILDKDYQYDQERYHYYHYSEPITEEQKEQSQKQYYEDLEKRVLEGDEQAKQEYEIYLIQQQLKSDKGKTR